MNGASVIDFDLIDGPVTLVGSEEPRFLQARDGTTDRASDVRDIEIRIWILGLSRIRDEIGFAVQIVELPGSEGGVLVVVERRAMVAGATALGVDANVGDTRVLGAEVCGQNVN